ncbi:hypothetical protein BC834DRAFT_892612 [Gloeopeniophorella convolvens]|nr:hypothetical protein BC834DRAFT_892612 [Gloeopeniophorella convolvens]
MPAVTRSRKRSKKESKVYVLIDKTPRNTANKPIKPTEKGNGKPKKKLVVELPVRRATAKSKEKAKQPVKSPSPQPEIEDEDEAGLADAEPADTEEPDEPLQHAVSAAGLSGGFATPPQSHLPPAPPKRPEPRSHVPQMTLPPQFNNDGTPSPGPRRRESHPSPARISPLPPSSPIQFSSSPERPLNDSIDYNTSILFSAHRPGTPSQFHTPTRKKRKRTPISQPRLSSEQEVEQDDLFAYGVVDEFDEREEAAPWENAGSDKENEGGPGLLPGSDDLPPSDNNPSMPLTSERGILQPRDPSSTPARSQDSDPFGFFATERLLKARRAEKMHNQPEAGPSRTHRGPRLPLGEIPAGDVAPIATTPQSIPLAASQSQSQPQSQPLPASSFARYSDSEIEDLYAPASPPRTPRERLPHPHAHDATPRADATPVAPGVPLTPRNGDTDRAFTVRRRRQKELHGVSEHGSEIEGSSAPSSPSPVKRTHARPPEPVSQLSDQDGEDEDEAERPQKKTRKGKGKENAGRRTEDPLEAARRVIANAPRRRPKRQAAAVGKRKSAAALVEGSSEAQEVRRTTRGRGRGRGGRGARGAGRVAGTSRQRKKADESTPEDVREVREEERQKRIDFFKSLDGYQLRKENVYVV